MANQTTSGIHDRDGLIGIGTISPSEILTVNGAGTFRTNANNFQTTSQFTIDYYDGDSTGRLAAYKSTGSNITFFTNAASANTAEVMRITGDGRVGIGTTDPLQELHVKVTSGNADVRVEGPTSTNYTDFYRGDSAGGIYVYGDTDFKIGANSGGGSNMFVADVSSGNIGINTATPTEKLHVEGSIRLNNTLNVNANYASFNQNAYYSSGWKKYATGYARRVEFGTDGYYYSISNAGAGAAGDAITWTNLLTVADTGGVTATSFTGSLQGNITGTAASETLATVTGRGASTSTALALNGKVVQGGGASRSSSGTTIAFTTNNTYSADSDAGDTNRFLSIVNESITTDTYAQLGFRSDPASGGAGNAMMDMKFVNLGSTSSKLAYTFLHGGTWYDRVTFMSNGNVGIGATNPGYKLDVVGDIRATGNDPVLVLQPNSGTYAFLQKLSTSNGDYLRLYDGTNYSMFWTGSNVGIGTTSPIADGLTIRREGGDRKVLLKLDRPNTAGLQTALQFTVSDIMVGQIQHEYAAANYNHMSFTLRAVNGSDIIPLWLQNSGNVGIGTSGPQSKLHVAGAGNANGGNILMGNGGSGTTKWSYLTGAHYDQATGTGNGVGSAGIAIIGTYATSTANEIYIGGAIYEANPATAIIFHTHTSNLHATGGTERMRITSTGYVGIGTNNPVTGIDVRTSGYSNTTARFGAQGPIYMVNGWPIIGFNTYYDNGWAYGGTENAKYGGTIEFDYINGHFYIGRSTATGNPGDALSKSTALAILNNGNVGIGIESPIAKFQISSGNNTATQMLVGEGSTYGAPSLRFVPAATNYMGIGFTTGSVVGNEVLDAIAIQRTGNVGIGTTNPTANLQIGSPGSTLTKDLLLVKGGGGSGNYGFRVQANNADELFLVDTYSYNVTIPQTGTTYGRLGIGTTSPDTKLHVITGGLSAGQSNSVAFFRSSTNIYFDIYNAVSATVNGGAGLSGTSLRGSDAIALAPNGSEVMRLESGKVGIGTTNPTARLDVYQSGSLAVNVAGSQGQLFSITDSLSGSLMSVNDISGIPILEVFSDDRVVAGQYGTNALVVNGGSVGIGTATPSFNFQVSETTYARVALHQKTTGAIWQWGNDGSNMYAYYTNTGVRALDINQSGNVGIGSASPAYKLDVAGTIRATGDVIAYSDRRVKQDIVTLENSVELVKKLRGVSYKKIGEDDQKIGVIAQEILEVLPQVVSKDENGMYSVAYGNMAGLFIEAIKEQQHHIESLEDRIQKLEQLLTQKP